ncbi:type II secretion system protein GspL [Solimonas sp. K1W22B-7]|uniref:type II secretion system protein GspL n=1 Tax=Solimonas sp. K1W22B-7 TaxID=2303331 RepID=UPI000E330B01|nr:type II secretion system protein GspL [Solimonas sp. K1W22B-7]AXQ29445.1 type II secretion system protein GspL [Solimonas sp. K1W22B-7]
MRNTLYIRLRATDLGTDTAYCIASPQAVASFPVQHAPLETILLKASGHRLVVLVPAADVRMATVDLPARQAAKVLQAAPYALEDQLADDVDTLHFAIGPRQKDGRWPVAVVSRARMNEWLRPFTERGLAPDVLLPDALCLPPAEGPRWSALAERDQVLVRNGAFSAFACSPEDLELMLQLADSDKKATLRITVPRDVSPDFTRLAWPVELLPGFISPLEALLQSQRPETGINLLQGRYSQREDLQRLWQPWKITAALLAIWIGFAAILHGVAAWQLRKQVQQQEDANIQRYQQLFPSEARILSDFAGQVEAQFAVLKGGKTGGGLLPLMQVLADALTAAPGLTLQAVQYREGALYASLSGSDLRQLETLKAWFASPRAASLEVQSANSGSEGAQIRIKLSPDA